MNRTRGWCIAYPASFCLPGRVGRKGRGDFVLLTGEWRYSCRSQLFWTCKYIYTTWTLSGLHMSISQHNGSTWLSSWLQVFSEYVDFRWRHQPVIETGGSYTAKRFTSPLLKRGNQNVLKKGYFAVASGTWQATAVVAEQQGDEPPSIVSFMHHECGNQWKNVLHWKHLRYFSLNKLNFAFTEALCKDWEGIKSNLVRAMAQSSGLSSPTCI